MNSSLSQSQETYRATYRGSRIVLAHANKDITAGVAQRMAKDIEWMREGDIDVRLHTLHQKARSAFEKVLPSSVLEQEGSARDAAQMITEITTHERGRMEELILLSSMRGIRNGKNRVMPLLSDTRIPELASKHPQEATLLSAIAVGLGSVPKIVFTRPQDLGEEISSVTGAGTMCFRRSSTTYSPMYTREEPIFLENYERNVADGTYRARSEAALKEAMDTHYCIRTGKSVIGGFSLIPRQTGRLSLETVWGCSRGGDLGSLILDHATEEAGTSSYYAMTVRSEVAEIFRRYPGIEDAGTVSELQKNGRIRSIAPEHEGYDTVKRDPYVFWHQGRQH